jgi:hypothetical protein
MGLMENRVVMPLMVFAVLFFAAGPPRPARSRGNNDTWEEAAGKTRRVSSGAVSDQKGKRSLVRQLVFQAGGFLGRQAPPGAAGKARFSRSGI